MPAPTLSGFAPSVVLDENTVNATPQLLDPDLTFADADGDFDGGTLTLSGLLAEDRVSVRDQGTGAGEIGLSGADVTFGGVVIGTLAGGVGGTLTITFNAAATTAAIDALIQNLTYANVSDTPTASRDLLLNVVDADGADLGALAGPQTFAVADAAGNPFAAIDTGAFSTPAFLDLDGDGDLDLMSGNPDGTLLAFENDGGVFTALVGAANPFDGVDLDDGTAPTGVDLDGDGDLDLVVGNRYGALWLFQNDGGVFVEQIGPTDPFAFLDVDDYSTPAFVDLDGDGDLDLVSGDGSGALFAFENDGVPFTPLVGAANPFDGIDVGAYSTPAFADLDGDGDLDLVSGDGTGALLAFENDGGVFTALVGAANPFAGVDVGDYSTPAFVDLDGDGDMDVVVGDLDGTLTTILNTTAHGRAITVTVTPEMDAITGDGDDNTVTGLAGDDVIEGLGGDDTLLGLGGNDLLDGGDGEDTADYSTAASGVVVRLFSGLTLNDGDGGTDTLVAVEHVTGSDFNDTILGSAGANTLFGGAGQDYLIGLGGNDILIGGTGDPNQLQGGLGDDIYVVQANDTLVEFAGEGHDTVSTIRNRLVLAANIEDLLFEGAGDFTGVGNGENNAVTGSDGNDILSGLGGDDVLDGGDGTDTADYSLAFSWIVASLADGGASDDGDGGVDTFTSIENLLGSAWDDDLTGDSGANVLDGGAGYDVLVGGGGVDILRGGDGYDTADYSDAAGGVMIKLQLGLASNDGDGASDQLIGIEDLQGSEFDDVLIGSAIDNYLYGGSGRDVLIGLDGDDLLEGGNGVANQLQGGLGDDRYYVEANDTLVEFANEGYDSVATTRNSYTLRANFEELAFDGVGDFVGTGNDLDNFIYGGEGDDTLTGGKGNDFMIGSSSCGCGGPGNDTVVLAGVLADYIIEDLGLGTWGITDTVADRDGEDFLADIAQLRFSDGSTYALVPASPAPGTAKDADIAQVLPGVIADDFLLPKDTDQPHVLPGEEGDIFGVLGPIEGVDLFAGFPTHMLALDGEGGFVGGTDDFGRLHDHDGWLF